jgi:hypothetical protein
VSGRPREDGLWPELRRRLPAGQRYAYCPNPGNGGDALIAVQGFEREGLPFELVPRDADLRGRHVVFGGGGNLVPAYDQARRFFERHRACAATLTLLPHTVRGHEDLLATLGPECLLFGRDEESCAHLARHAPGATVAFGHDLALSLDLADPRLAPPGLVVRWRSGRRYRRALAQVRRGLAPFRGARELLFFRDDVERAPGRTARGFDLSRALELYRGERPPLCFAISAAFLAALAPFESVVTDRLHGAVAGALLGKRVQVFDNAYGKISAIYRSSLAERFGSQLRFGGAEPS